MLFAEIAVDTYQDPTKRLFTYEIPEGLEKKVKPGDLVEVPFGKRTVGGFIWQLTKARRGTPHLFRERVRVGNRRARRIKIKPIKNLKTKGVLAPNQVKLAHWMSSYYAAPPLDCLKCQIPGKGERHTEGKDSEIKTLLLVPYATQVKLKAWELPRSERKVVLVGSRSAVFAPLPNLEKIIIEEPENWTYKDERSPYYHAKDVAHKRVELEGLKLELRYLIPRVEDISVPPRKTPASLTPGVKSAETPGVSPAGVEKGGVFLQRRGNLPVRSSTLRDEPSGSDSNEQAGRRVKIVDLKKERDAGNFSPLSSEVVEAFKQGKRTGPPATLKRSFCGLAYVHSRKVKQEVSRSIRAEGLDANRIEIAGAEIFAQVGKAYDTAALIDADTLFNLPDFRAHEKLLLTVVKLAQLIRQRRTGGEKLFVQTANPGFPLWRELKSGDLKNFYQRELQARKPLLYPPFGVLAKLEFSAKTTAKVNAEAEKLYEKLSAISDQRSAIRVSPPYPPYTKSRGKAQLNIAVQAKAHHELEKTLALVPHTWKIIIDPESLL